MKTCCGYSLEAPRRGASNEYPKHMFSSRNKKNIFWIPPLICSYAIIQRRNPNTPSSPILITGVWCLCVIIKTIGQWRGDDIRLFTRKHSICNHDLNLPPARCITKTCLYNFDLLKPHFYVVKLGFTGVYIICLISAQKHNFWVLVRSASMRQFQGVPTIYVLSRNMKNIIFFFLSENFQFLEVKYSIYLNTGVFVMQT